MSGRTSAGGTPILGSVSIGSGHRSAMSPMPVPVPVMSPSPLTSPWATADMGYAQKLYSPITMYLNDTPMVASTSLQMMADSINSGVSSPSSGFPLFSFNVPSSATDTNSADANTRHSIADEEEDEELRELNKHHKQPAQPTTQQQQSQSQLQSDQNQTQHTQHRKTTLQDVLGKPVSISPHIFGAGLESSHSLPNSLPSSPPPFAQSPLNNSNFL